jgi:two-component system sensor histidine kinase DesK
MSDNFNQSLVENAKTYWLWIPLFFSSFYFIPFILSPNYFSIFNGSIAVAIYAIFLFLYYQAANSIGDKVSLIIMLLMLIVCVLGTYITPGTQALFGFIGFFCGYNLAAKKGILCLFSLLLSILATAFMFNMADVFFIVPPVILSVSLFFTGRAVRKDNIYEQQQKQSKATISQLATIAERERISRDLHDLIGHSLTSIALKAELAEKYLIRGKGTQAQQEVIEVAQLSRDVLSQVRHAVSGLKQQNFSAQLTQLTNKLSHHGFTVNLTTKFTHLSPIIESTLILILTEAVTNILKHSHGDTVDIKVNSLETNLSLSIADNGEKTSFFAGNGLDGIAHRCKALNGSCDIQHKQGFMLTITLPQEDL